jgi:dienelactone hydrolase
MRYCVLLLLPVLLSSVDAQDLRVFPPGELPNDVRLGELRTLNGYFPFESLDSVAAWEIRQAEIRRRILVSQGLWPMPTRTPLNAVVHGRVERDDYVVDRVYFESIPGHFVTGSLYRPKGKEGKSPAILSPHGHWKDGRFYDAGETQVAGDLKSGAERFAVGGRYPIQARAVHLARMGCIVFIYDMTGNADSIQIAHRPDRWQHLDRTTDWGFMSVQADLRLQNMMGLQTWNSIRAIDFLSQLDDVDPKRIGVTGASGGGTQSMIIGAIDDRIAAAMPCVMVSTSMQGGCTCENAPLLRIDQGNVDIAAAVAPRPLGLTAADDWTVELQTKGYPDLVKLYERVGAADHLTAVFHTQFKHNYNQVNRAAMYRFFNRHFDLGIPDSFVESDFVPLSVAEATVWTDDQPAPSGEDVGDAHEVRILKLSARDSDRRMEALVPKSEAEVADFRRIVGGGWRTILSRQLSQVGAVRFTETDRGAIGTTRYQLGHLAQVDTGEQIPVLRVSRMGQRKSPGILVWIDDSGKRGLLDGDTWIEPVQTMLDKGYQIIAADLYGQGEFAADEQPLDAQPMWYQRNAADGWQRFSGYTYGYNHSMFVKRAHDVLALIKLASSESQTVHLVGLGTAAGPLVAAARSQLGDGVDQTFIDLDGFRFQSLARHDDPMFVPGAVKYLDVDGLIALCAPARVSVAGVQDDATANSVYRATRSGDSFKRHPDRQSLLRSMATAFSR